jgi:sporulation protein YlmC with PRC-barrel domain
LHISKGENVIPYDLIGSIGDKIILKDTFEWVFIIFSWY